MQKVAAFAVHATRLPCARALLCGLVLAISPGCGSSDDDKNGTSETFGMSWEDDGTADKSVGAKASFDSAGGADAYEINGIGDRATVTVEVTVPTPIKPRTLECNGTKSGEKVRISYYPTSGGVELTDESCSVVLTKAGGVGDTVSGTFEAVIALRDGGTKAISGGTFNLHVSAL